jgi:hypothetical protein
VRLVQWLREKYQRRRAEGDDHDPWWVRLLLDVGRPIVAVLILAMCAPGEHYLARQAGWSERLAWGMPGTLTAYAGIAAVVATKRPRGAPGRNTAVWGAVLSILVAMAAQPIAHLYGRTGLDPQEIVLTVAVSCIPAAVFGHLLHMGASVPKSVRPDTMDIPPLVHVDIEEAVSDGHPDMMSTFLAGRTPGLVTDTSDTPVSASDMDRRTEAAVSAGVLDKVSDPIVRTEDPDTSVRVSMDTVAVQSMSGSMSAAVRDFLSGNPDATDTELSAAIEETHPGTPWNSIYKARVRYEEKIGKRRAG